MANKKKSKKRKVDRYMESYKKLKNRQSKETKAPIYINEYKDIIDELFPQEIGSDLNITNYHLTSKNSVKRAYECINFNIVDDITRQICFSKTSPELVKKTDEEVIRGDNMKTYNWNSRNIKTVINESIRYLENERHQLEFEKFEIIEAMDIAKQLPNSEELILNGISKVGEINDQIEEIDNKIKRIMDTYEKRKIEADLYENYVIDKGLSTDEFLNTIKQDILPREQKEYQEKCINLENNSTYCYMLDAEIKAINDLLKNPDKFKNKSRYDLIKYIVLD